MVFNTLAWPRSGMAAISLEFAEGECAGLKLTDPSGADVPCLADGMTRHGDGSLAAVTLTFRAADVPPLGYRTFVARVIEPGPHPEGTDPAAH